MKAREAAAKKKLVDSSVGRLKLFMIENGIGSAMPDMVGENRKGSSFWLEAKQLEKWPVRDSTMPLKGKFEKGQQGWSKAWSSWGGNSFCFLRIGEARSYDYYLVSFLKGDLQKMTKSEIMNAVIVSGLEEIITFLEEL